MSTLISFTTVNWLWFFSAMFIGSVPLFLQIINYNRTGSKDYLLYASLFLFSAYIWFIGSFTDRTVEEFTHRSIMITFYVLHFLIVLHSTRLRWRKSPKIILYPSIIGLLVIEIAAIFSSWEALLHFWELEQVVGGLVHIWTGVILLYAYYTVDPVLKSSRIQIVRRGFIIVGLFVIGQGVIESVGRFLIFGPDFSEILIGITTTIYSLILCFVAIFYPESMLISHVQILRASDLYKKVQEYQTIERYETKEDTIISYLFLLNNKGLIEGTEKTV